jgi:hypothetical protein
MTTSTHPGMPTLLDSSLFERGLAPLPPTPPMLTAGELVDWVALSRVIIGRVVRDPRGTVFDDGQPMPGYLLPELLFDSLEQVGYVAFAAPDPLGLSTASLTDAGLAHYTHLAQLGQPQP